MKTKNFHISDILSVTTGKQISTRNMEGIYDILSFMIQSEVYTTSIPRIRKACRQEILKKYPSLENVSLTSTKEGLEKWLVEQAKKYGEYLPIDTVGEGVIELIDPMDEFKILWEKSHKNKIQTFWERLKSVFNFSLS